MKPRVQPAAVLLPVLSNTESAGLKKSLEFIYDETQRTLERCNRQPVYAVLLRKLANNYTMMSRINKELRDSEQAIRDGMHAIEMLGRIDDEDKNFGDFYKMTQFYRELALMCVNDQALSAIFQFGGDYFGGKNSVCFSRLNEVVKTIHKNCSSSMQHHSALLQLIKLIRSTHLNNEFPSNVLKDELKDYYYQKRFAEIIGELNVRESKLLDQVCDELQAFFAEITAPEAHADVEMRVAGFEQPVRAAASAGGMFRQEQIVKPGRVAELVKKMDAYPIMK